MHTLPAPSARRHPAPRLLDDRGPVRPTAAYRPARPLPPYQLKIRLSPERGSESVACYDWAHDVRREARAWFDLHSPRSASPTRRAGTVAGRFSVAVGPSDVIYAITPICRHLQGPGLAQCLRYTNLWYRRQHVVISMFASVYVR